MAGADFLDVAFEERRTALLKLAPYRRIGRHRHGRIAKSKRRHFFQRGMQLRIAAGLKRNHKRQRRFVESGFLQQRIDVQVMCRENLRQPRHNPRLIAHEEAQIPRRFKITADSRAYETLLATSLFARPAPMLSATNIRSDTTATAVGSPPAPAPRNAMSPPYFPEVKTRLRFLCTRPNGESFGTRHGPTSANSVSLFQVGPRNLADRASEFRGVVEVDRIDRANRASSNRFRARLARAVPPAQEWRAWRAHRRRRDPRRRRPRRSPGPALLPALR